MHQAYLGCMLRRRNRYASLEILDAAGSMMMCLTLAHYLKENVHIRTWGTRGIGVGKVVG